MVILAVPETAQFDRIPAGWLMLATPNETNFDLRFRAFGIPVRVHPLFWLISALLGWQDGYVQGTLIWVGCVFVSILVHEFGHGLMAAAFGYRPSIVLYGMGGLCYSEGERQSRGQRLAVLIAGPGAGFLLAGLVVVGHLAAGEPRLGPAGESVYRYLIFINLFWGFINLLPIWPLDGGQMTGVSLSWFSPRNGMRWGHVISLLASGVLAVCVFSWTRDFFLTLFFAYFAFINYQVLSAYHRQYHSGFEDEGWR